MRSNKIKCYWHLGKLMQKRKKQDTGKNLNGLFGQIEKWENDLLVYLVPDRSSYQMANHYPQLLSTRCLSLVIWFTSTCPSHDTHCVQCSKCSNSFQLITTKQLFYWTSGRIGEVVKTVLLTSHTRRMDASPMNRPIPKPRDFSYFTFTMNFLYIFLTKAEEYRQ